MNRFHILFFIPLFFSILSGCSLSRSAAYMTPGSEEGFFSYDDSIQVILAGQAGGIDVTWLVETTASDDAFWVARGDNYYLNDYAVISGKLSKDTRSFTDSTAVHGHTYVYRVLRYYTSQTTTSTYNGNTWTTTTTTTYVHNMSGAVSIVYP